DPVVFEIQVTNSGTDQAKNINVRNLLSAGLNHEQGPAIDVALGSLTPGECVKLSLKTVALETGIHGCEVTAQGTDGISAGSEASVLVTQPAVQIRFTGPASLPLNKVTEFLLVATNSGTATAENLEGSYVIPEGLDFVPGEGRENYDPDTRTIS